MAVTTIPPATVPAIEPIKLVSAIIQQEMSLPNGQIMLSFENFPIAEVPGLYVALAYGPEEVIGNNNYNDVDAYGNYVEVQDVVMCHQIVIDIMSYDSSARTQKEMVLQALASENAQNLANQYQMKIATTPGAFLPLTDSEPSKQLNRFQISIKVNALHRKVIYPAYYDNLQKVQLTENP